MSQSLLNPQPQRLGAFRFGTVDTRAYDFFPDLGALDDPIASITSVTVARRDGQAIGAMDLMITPPGKMAPWLDETGYVVNWWQSAGAGTSDVDYIITVSVESVGGRTVVHDCYQLVVIGLG